MIFFKLCFFRCLKQFLDGVKHLFRAMLKINGDERILVKSSCHQCNMVINNTLLFVMDGP